LKRDPRTSSSFLAGKEVKGRESQTIPSLYRKLTGENNLTVKSRAPASAVEWTKKMKKGRHNSRDIRGKTAASGKEA